MQTVGQRYTFNLRQGRMYLPLHRLRAISNYGEEKGERAKYTRSARLGGLLLGYRVSSASRATRVFRPPNLFWADSRLLAVSLFD